LTLASAAWLDVPSADFMKIVDRASAIGKTVAARDLLTVRRLIERVRIYDGMIEIDCATSVVADCIGATLSDDAPATITVTSEVRLTRSGNVMRLVQHNGDAVTERPDQSLIRLLVRARGWWAQLRTGEVDIKRLAVAENVHPSYLSRVLRLAFLSPAVIDAILAGRVRPEVDVAMLVGTGGIFPIWVEQRQALLSAVG
jgi:site-specific DNA recombinase